MNEHSHEQLTIRKDYTKPHPEREAQFFLFLVMRQRSAFQFEIIYL